MIHFCWFRGRRATAKCNNYLDSGILLCWDMAQVNCSRCKL